MSMRWAVEIRVESGDDIIADVLGSLGYSVEDNLVRSTSFETLEDWRAVEEVAYELSHQLREISRLDTDIDVKFEVRSVREFDAGGNQVRQHTRIRASGAALALRAHVAAVANVVSSRSPDEQAEAERRARADRAAHLLRATSNCELVLTVMRLLNGEPGSLELQHAHDLIRDDMSDDLTPFASRKQLTRFNRSINHPKVLGLKARHAVSNQEPPPDPMSLEDATNFIRALARQWIDSKSN